MPTTISKLKKKLDVLFSQYIRRRNADHLGRVKCFTCGVEKHWKEQQAGHFQSRSHHSTRWDEVNVQVQCVKCNMYRPAALLPPVLNSILVVHAADIAVIRTNGHAIVIVRHVSGHTLIV